MVLRLQSVEESSVGSLGLGLAVEQQGSLVGAPGLQETSLVSYSGRFWSKMAQTYGVVGDTPRGDTNAVGNIKARVHSLKVVC